MVGLLRCALGPDGPRIGVAEEQGRLYSPLE